MKILFLDISHIADAIFSALSPTDRWSCLLVSRAWHDALVPVYWRDVVLFSRKWIEVNPPHKPKWIYNGNLPLLAPHQALMRNARYIRALSCNGTSTLPLLASFECTNLIELCFVVDDPEEIVEILESSSVSPSGQHQTVQGGQGLNQLAQYVVCNPHLRAISVENVTLNNDEDMGELLRFVKFLDSIPSITSFHLGFREEEEENPTSHPDLQKTLVTILNQRLDLIQSSSVHSLQLCRGRIPEGQRLVTGRGRKGGEKVGSDLWSAEYGFLPDDERFVRMGQNRSLAILENNGLLELVLPSVMMVGSRPFRLRCYPSVRSLSCREMIGDSAAQFLRDIPTCLPALQNLDVDVQNPQVNVLSAFFQDTRLNLSSLSLREISSVLYSAALHPLLQSHGHTGSRDVLRTALVRLNTWGGHLAMSQLLELLAACPNLQHLVVGSTSIGGTEPETCPPWACQLRTLSVDFGPILSGHSRESAAKTAASFTEQLGQQTLLRDLNFNFFYTAELSDFPILDLSFGFQNGLKRLSRLSSLELFSMMGKCHRVERSEIEWMAIHWPRLRCLEISSSLDLDINHDEYLARLSSYWPTIPKLQVYVAHWY